MNAWILIVVMTAPSGYASVVSMQEFNTESACQYVANYMAQFTGLRRASCVRKGETK